MPKELHVPKSLLEEAKLMRERYKEHKLASIVSAIILGKYGVGKTRFICTGRKPMIIHSFDPNGTIVIEQDFQEDIDKGNILIDRFWVDSAKDPRAFKEWEVKWEQYRREGWFNYLGTYAIDSGTHWIEAIANHISKTNKLGPGELEIGDYKTIKNIVKDYVKLMAGYSCDFFLTMHLTNIQDGVTGEVTAEPDIFPSLREDIPRLFTEKWILTRKQTNVEVLMQPLGRYHASTQIGSKKFDLKEGANIRALLKKAGREYKHKPSLFEVDPSTANEK